MNSLRGLVIINPTLKYNRARSLTHRFGQRSPFTSSLEAKAKRAGRTWPAREFKMLLQLECFLSSSFFSLAELGCLTWDPKHARPPLRYILKL